MVISILLKPTFSHFQSIVNHWWKFYSNQTRIKSFLKRLKHISMASEKHYRNTLYSWVITDHNNFVGTMHKWIHLTYEIYWSIQRLHVMKPKIHSTNAEFQIRFQIFWLTWAYNWSWATLNQSVKTIRQINTKLSMKHACLGLHWLWRSMWNLLCFSIFPFSSKSLTFCC